MVTAPGSGAEVIPFLKTYVNLPMAIGFTVIYAQVGFGGSPGCHVCPELLPPVACCPCRAVTCAACTAVCCALLLCQPQLTIMLPLVPLHSVLQPSVRCLLQPAPLAASHPFCACCSWPMCCPQRRCSIPASSPSSPSLAHSPSSCTLCGMCSTPTVSLTAACRCLLAWGQLAEACIRLQRERQDLLSAAPCCFLCPKHGAVSDAAMCAVLFTTSSGLHAWLAWVSHMSGLPAFQACSRLSRVLAEHHWPDCALILPAALADKLVASWPKGFAGPIAIFRNWSFCLFYVMAELWGSVVVSLLFWGFANQVSQRCIPPLGMDAIHCSQLLLLYTLRALVTGR